MLSHGEKSIGRRLAVVVLFGSFLVGLTVGARLAPAGASPMNCFTGLYKMQFGPDNNSDGVRVQTPGMTVYDNTESCVRISSIAAISDDGDFAEVGWYEQTGGDSLGCDGTSGPPKLLVYAMVNGNLWGCKHPVPNLTGGDVDSFSTNDFNRDSTWVYWWNGNSEGSYDLLWNSGDPIDNGERHSQVSTNHSTSNFNGLQYGDPTGPGWLDWPSSLLSSNSDGGYYKGCNYGGVHTTVIAVSSSC